MIQNSRESMLSHESQEYIDSRPDWVIGKVPDLSDYRKLSVDSMKEAITLARLGQEVASRIIPASHGKPLLLYFTQALIIGAAILDRETAKKKGLDFEKYRSVLMITPSRYGKSYLNAIACITEAGAAGKEVHIVGATKDKANIIQDKIVQFLPDTIDAVQKGLLVTSEEEDVTKKIKRLATQVSKEALMWRNGGSIKLASTNESTKNSQVGAAGVIGLGGDYMVFDELQLMSPVGFRTASRFMMEGPDTKRFCVGNPSINGHFKELYDDPSTFVIHINDICAIVEQRMTRKGFQMTGIPEYSDEYRSYILTEFPDSKSGSRFFSTLPEIWDSAKRPMPQRKTYFMGIDSAYKGADSLNATIVSLNEAEGERWVVCEKQIDFKEKYPNWEDDTTLNISLDLLKLWDEYDIAYGCIDIGFGIHIYERMKNLYEDLPLEPINFASNPTEWRKEIDYNAKFASNTRAEMHMDLKDLSENGHIYICNESYDVLMKQMREVGQSPQNAKIRIESKKDIKARLGRSPDNLDSLCLAVHAMVISGVLTSYGDMDVDALMDIVND